MNVSLKLSVLVSLSFFTLLLVAEPAVAQENVTEQAENVDWMSLMSGIIEFFAKILEKAAEIMRKGVENLQG